MFNNKYTTIFIYRAGFCPIRLGRIFKAGLSLLFCSEDLKHQLTSQERTIAEKTKSLKMQQQTINDLKKTIKRELKGHDQGHLSEVKGHDSMDRVRSSPALSELDR